MQHCSIQVWYLFFFWFNKYSAYSFEQLLIITLYSIISSNALQKNEKKKSIPTCPNVPCVLYSKAKTTKKNLYPGNSSLLRQLFMYSLFWRGMKEKGVFFVFKVLLHMHFNARKEKEIIKKKKKKDIWSNILKLIPFIPFITNTLRLIQLCSGLNILPCL